MRPDARRVLLFCLVPALLAVAAPVVAGPPAAAAAQQAAKPSDAQLLRSLDREARSKGTRDYAIGRRTCERLGVTPIGDCTAFRLEPSREADGFQRSLATFDEPGTGTVRIIVFRQNAGEIYYYLCGLDGMLVRAAYQNRSTVWYKLPNDDAQAGFRQELDFWRAQQSAAAPGAKG